MVYQGGAVIVLSGCCRSEAGDFSPRLAPVQPLPITDFNTLLYPGFGSTEPPMMIKPKMIRPISHASRECRIIPVWIKSVVPVEPGIVIISYRIRTACLTGRLGRRLHHGRDYLLADTAISEIKNILCLQMEPRICYIHHPNNETVAHPAF